MSGAAGALAFLAGVIALAEPEGLPGIAIAACIGQGVTLLIRAVALRGVAFAGGPSLVSRPAETRGGLQRPATVDKTSTDKGPVRPKRVLAPLAAPALPVDAFAHRLSPSRWSRRTVSEGTKGPLASACARTRVTRGKEGLPERTGGLVSTRTLGARPTEA